MADPLLSGFLIQALASALDEATRATVHATTTSRRRVMLVQELETDPTVRAAIEQATAHLAEAERIDPRLGGERLRTFFGSTECRRALVPLFYETELEQRSLATLRAGFRASLAHATGMRAEDVAVHGDRLFDALAAASRRSLQVALTDRGLAALDASAQLRHTVLRYELANVESKIELLARPDAPSQEAIAGYAFEYRHQVAHREGSVMPPHLEGQVRRPLDDIYVPPRLLPEHDPAPPPDDRWIDVGRGRASRAYPVFVKDIARTVVLGDPGGGKTTLTKRIAVDVSTAAHPPDAGVVPRVAIRIVLRDYGAAKRERPGWSLLRQIETTAASRYQLPDPPPGVFDYLLRNGLALVLLDGLDELLDTARRREISADVESFGHLFPTVPLLVTSRRVGYDQAPLDPRSFATYSLLELNDDEVRAYTAKAFSLGQPVPLSVDAPRVNDFMSDSRRVADLRSNPLLLGLMCNLYRGRGFIPDNRPDVYEKCALMLFEQWDRSRGIDEEIPFEAELRPALRYIAHWIFSSPDGRAGVTEQELIRTTAAYQLRRNVDDPDKARAAAIDLVRLCKGRAWVFTDTGTTADGTPLFQFTHRTFLEYFTAAYLVATNATPEQLADTMLAHVALREWDTVLQLAAQLQARNLEDGADALLERLLSAELDDDERYNVVAFARESLAYLAPSPELTRRLVRDAVAEVAREVRSGAPLGDVRPITALLAVGPQRRALVRETLVAELVAVAEEDPRELAQVELALHALPQHGPSHWVEASADVAERLRPLLLEIAETDMPIAQDLLERGMLPASTFVERFGTEPLFDERPFRHLNQVSRLALLVEAFVDLATRPPEQHDVELVRSLAAALRDSPPPWAFWETADRDAYEMVENNPGSYAVPHPSEAWDRDARFVAFALLAVLEGAPPRLKEADESPPHLLGIAEEEHDEERFWWRYNAWVDTPLGALERLVLDAEADERPGRLLDAPDAALAQRWLDGSIRLVH